MKRLASVLRQRKGVLAMGVVFVCFLALSVWSRGTAQDADATTPAGTPPAGAAPSDAMPSLGGAALKIVSSVALVIGLLYAGVYLTRLLSRKVNTGGVKADAIAVIHKRHIAPKKAIYVVAIGSRAMVVGVTDTQINHLADLSQDEVEAIRVPQPDRGAQFKKHLLSFGFGIDDKSKGT